MRSGFMTYNNDDVSTMALGLGRAEGTLWLILARTVHLFWSVLAKLLKTVLGSILINLIV